MGNKYYVYGKNGNYVYVQTTDYNVGHSMNFIFFKDRYNNTKAIVIDCGISYKDKNQENLSEEINKNIICDISKIKAVLITHAHNDHLGLLPYLVSLGYSGKIYSSEVVRREAGIILRDSAKVMSSYGEYYYNNDDIDLATSMIKPVPCNKEFEIYNDGEIIVTATGLDNPHLNGAYSWSLLFTKYSYEDISITFSGDVKKDNEMFYTEPIPEFIKKRPTTIICESTYGDCIRKKDSEQNFEELVKETYDRGGNVIIASIANERAEIILNHLLKMKENNMIPQDTKIFVKGILLRKLYNIINNSGDVIKFKEDFCDTSNDIIFMDQGEVLPSQKQYILVVSPGMLGGGASLEAAFAEAYNEKSMLILTSYVPEKGIAYNILHTPKGGIYKHTDGRNIKINMDVRQCKYFSGHADELELMEFIMQFTVVSVLCNHGEQKTIEKFAEDINSILKVRAYATSRKKCFRISSHGVDENKILNSKIDVASKTKQSLERKPKKRKDGKKKRPSKKSKRNKK